MSQDRGPFFSNPFVAQAARWGLLAWSVIGILILVGVLYRYVLHPIRVVFPPLVVALIVINLLNPLVTRLHERGISRIWGTLVCYVVFLSLVGIALAYLIPVVTDQVKAFVGGIPDLLAKAQADLTDFAARFGIRLRSTDLLQSFQPGSGRAFNFLGRLTSFTSGVVHLALVFVLGPLLAFYLLVDLPKLQRSAESIIPASRREELRGLAKQVGATVGGFFRGQLLVALLVGGFCLLGYFVVGLPYFALIGALTMLLALVPLIGVLLAAIPALFVAFTTSGRTGGLLHISGGWKLALACSIVLLAAQQLDMRVLSPRLHSRSVRLHPVTVLLSLLVGGTLLGLWGMLLAVPVVAALKVVMLHVWDTRAQWPPKGPEAVAEPGAPGASATPAASHPASAASGDGAQSREVQGPREKPDTETSRASSQVD
ncbi:MAG: AI-2E family transporter [Actinomycetota bacterium]